MSTTPMMGLTLPAPGTTPGPTWASQLVTALETIDSHDHTSGHGTLVPVAALNLNDDLDLGSAYSLTMAVSIDMADQDTALSTGSSRIFSHGGELYFRDESSNNVQITLGGVVNSAGSGAISGLVAPATASYSEVNQTFTWLVDTGEAAKMAVGDLLVYRNGEVSPNPVTIKTPVSLAAAYTLTLPTAQAAGVEYLSIDSSGNLDHATLAGTADQVNVSASATAITLSTPQSIATTSSPTFAGLLTGAGSAGTPGLRFSTDTNTGMYSVAADQIGFSTGGTNRVTINSSGLTTTASLTAASNVQVGADLNCDGTTTLDNTTIDGTCTVTGTLQVASGGAFKVKTFSGSLAASGTVDLACPSGTIIAVFGWAQKNGTTSWAYIGDQSDTGKIVLAATAGTNTSTNVRLFNDAASTSSYKLIMFYA